VTLRVCLDARFPTGQAGGIEQLVIGLAWGLSQLEARDEEYLFLTYRDAADWLIPYLGDNARILDAGPAPGNGVVRRLAQTPWVRASWGTLSPNFGPWRIRVPTSDGLIEQEGIRVMHFTKQSGFLTPVASIYHPHDLQHLHLPNLFPRRTRTYREVTYRTLCRQAAMVAVSSSWTKQDIVRAYGLTREKVCVVPLGSPLTAYADPTPEHLATTRRKFSLPQDFALYPARPWPHKNHAGLLEALASLRWNHGLVVPVVFTGAPTEFVPRLRRRIQDLSMGDQVRLLGFVTPVELKCLYRLSRCVVIPSQFESASFPLLEAFTAGVPVAASNVTSLPAQAGGAALMFDPRSTVDMAETVRRLWTDEALRGKLVVRGRRRAELFTWQRTARLFRAHYWRIVGRKLGLEDRLLLAERPPV
jgi:glycosyltransferase involved in cell wall biosynthesis